MPIRNLFIILLVSLPILGACTSSAPTKYYVLESNSIRNLAQLPEGLRVGIGPISIPHYLNRNQITIRTSRTELALSETHQWSEPLKTGIARSIMISVGEKIKSNQIFEFSSNRLGKFDIQIPIEIVNFEGNLGEEVILLARWTILNRKTKVKIRSDISEIRRRPSDNSYQAYVSALSETLDTLADQIAVIIRPLGS